MLDVHRETYKQQPTWHKAFSYFSGRRFDRSTLGILLLLPLAAVLLGLIAYPIASGVYLSLLNKSAGSPGTFVAPDSTVFCGHLR
jgi:ABC-type sugar transport system permease subunit